MHAAPRRSVASWPAVMLPGALLLALLTAGAGGTASAGGSYEQRSDQPVTELHVVDAR